MSNKVSQWGLEESTQPRERERERRQAEGHFHILAMSRDAIHVSSRVSSLSSSPQPAQASLSIIPLVSITRLLHRAYAISVDSSAALPLPLD